MLTSSDERDVHDFDFDFGLVAWCYTSTNVAHYRIEWFHTFLKNMQGDI